MVVDAFLRGVPLVLTAVALTGAIYLAIHFAVWHWEDRDWRGRAARVVALVGPVSLGVALAVAAGWNLR